MSRIILNQIALQKIKVISETKKYFLLQPSSAAAPSTSNYGITPPTYTQTGYSGWSDTEPSYIVGDDRVLYELTETIYSDRTWDYSTPTISSSYKAAKEAYNEAIQAEEDIQDFVDLGLKQGYIWDNPTSKPASGTIPVYPAGSYIASGILSGGTRSINRSNSNTYGLNTWISTGGINLRYNAIDLMKLTTSNLFFYYPSTSTQQKKAISLGTNGAVNSLAFYGFNNDNKTMELTNNALTFYNPSNGTDKLATLNTSGLILSKGGIEGGSSTSGNGYIYLSTEDKAGITINGHTPGTNDNNPKWRAVIGSKFGVDSEGNLYANEAHVSGEITASKLTISSNATINDTSGLIRNDAINIGGRNLVWDTEWKNISIRWTNWGTPTTREIVTLDGKRWLHLVTTAKSYQGYSQNWTKRENPTSEIQAGDTIVFSYTAYAETAGQVCTVGCHWNDSSGSIVNQNWFASSLTTTPKRYTSQPFTVPANAVKFNVMIGQGVAQVQDLYITEVKIEKGNKATDWTPAPEDVKSYTDTAISEVVSQIDETQATVNATAAKTSSMSYENGELILSDSTNAFAVKITNTKLSFMQGVQEVAYISGNLLHIPYTVVLNAMDIGPWRWRKQDNGNLTLQYIG